MIVKFGLALSLKDAGTENQNNITLKKKILSIFTLISINFYCMNARDAVKLKLILHMYNFMTRLRNLSERRQTSWLFTSLAEELNTERPRNS